jgi:hypothetical protein
VESLVHDVATAVLIPELRDREGPRDSALIATAGFLSDDISAADLRLRSGSRAVARGWVRHARTVRRLALPPLPKPAIELPGDVLQFCQAQLAPDIDPVFSVPADGLVRDAALAWCGELIDVPREEPVDPLSAAFRADPVTLEATRTRDVTIRLCLVGERGAGVTVPAVWIDNPARSSVLARGYAKGGTHGWRLNVAGRDVAITIWRDNGHVTGTLVADVGTSEPRHLAPLSDADPGVLFQRLVDAYCNERGISVDVDPGPFHTI